MGGFLPMGHPSCSAQSEEILPKFHEKAPSPSWVSRKGNLPMSHSYVVFSDDGEGREKVGHDEELSDFFAEVE
jgi:hypothetical protein